MFALFVCMRECVGRIVYARDRPPVHPLAVVCVCGCVCEDACECMNECAFECAYAFVSS
jgi:hypothetical protein